MEGVSQAQAALGTKVCVSCGQRFPSDGLFCPNDGSPLQSASSADRTEASDPYLGRELSGHIEIRQLIGIGAMGRVYRAFQRGVDRDVAVKILHRELSANAQLVSRFTREAKVASRLQHPNVVHVILAGQLPDGALYMVMEYLDGLSLQSALAAAGGAMDLPRALHLVLQLCEAVGEAHAQGIVHRDLKPENVMLVRRGNDDDFVKVLDFGIARINWGEQSMSTAAGLIFGTARYISPEGAQGQTVRPQSDVYSIATLLFQMLAGRTPFEGDQAVALLVQQTHDLPPPLRSIPRSEYVPQPIADVIMANLAKDADRREPDARAFGHAILDAAQASGLSTDDISRPLHRRTPSVVKLPPLERTRQHELSPELAAKIGAPAAATGDDVGKRAPTAATVKWSPPSDFSSKLSPAPPTSAPSMPEPKRSKGVDRTLDDVDAPPPPSPSAPALAGKTEYAEPEPPPAAPPPREPERARAARPPSDAGERRSRPTLQSESEPAPAEEERAEPIRSRAVVLVLLCFVIGVAIAAGVAWRSGRIGGESELESSVARATDAMFQNRFAEPPGNNVKDITDEGLKRWPGDRRLLDVRARAANELVSQAMAQRAAGETAEALKLVRLAVELDPNDPSARRLADQYEIDLASAQSPAPAPKLPTPKPTAAATPSKAYKVQVDVSSNQARLGQVVSFTAHLTPAKGAFEGAAFSVSGPGVTALAVPAQGGEAGVFKASHAFAQPGKFDVTFVVKADGKELRAARPVTVVDVKVGPAPTAHPPTPATTTAPQPTAPTPSATSTGGVKWM
mgnify:CR=1 FL=1